LERIKKWLNSKLICVTNIGGKSMNEHRNLNLRDEILSSVANRNVTASIIADDEGVISETDTAAEEAKGLGLVIDSILGVGSLVKIGDEVARFSGSPKQIAMAEEVLLGIIAKPSGIATAVSRFIEKAGHKPQIVCGAWKKMPPSQKETIRRAVKVGGGAFRITQEPFVYLDKNVIEMLGGIRLSLSAVSMLTGYVKVVQIKGRYHDIAQEACEAVKCGASIIFIDTGLKEDIQRVSVALVGLGLRSGVKIAFGGNIRLVEIDELKTMDIDILDIGRSILDAPLLDMRLEVAYISDT
jgi:nicotinate-nucleotide pyrophosphorylase (carboxylating)